jgi:hypothetical protein
MSDATSRSTVQIRIAKRDGESRLDVEHAMAAETRAAYTLWSGSWINDVLIWETEITGRELCDHILQIHVGEFFYNDSVACPTCKRVNEVKP